MNNVATHFRKPITVIWIAAWVGMVTGSLPAYARSTQPSLLVIDTANGRALQAHQPDLRRYPASLTKMMTLYLLFEALDRKKIKLTSPMRASRHAAAQPPTSLGLTPGDTIRVDDAIRALVTKSANDVAALVGEALAGTETRFASRMTAKARALGMRNTVFANASGLPHPSHRTTARDMAVLAKALLRDFPHRYHYFSTRRFIYRGAIHTNHNRLLGHYRGLDGMKTGFTRDSGYNLVASARRNGHRLVGVALGCHSAQARNELVARALDAGFESLAEGRR